MKLMLDHTHRLNLHALLGAQRGDVALIRAIWAIQDRLALSPEEEASIELRRELIGGHERIVWNPKLSIPKQDFNISESDAARIKAALESWDGYGTASDRSWLEPLLNAITANDPTLEGRPQ